MKGDLLSTMFCKNKMNSHQYRQCKLKMYSRWEDTLEERLAGVRAAKAKLEEQIKRDATEKLHDDMRDSV